MCTLEKGIITEILFRQDTATHVPATVCPEPFNGRSGWTKAQQVAPTSPATAVTMIAAL